MSIAAAVLAAGGSSRFIEGSKLLVTFRGRPLVAWALGAAAEAGLSATSVVSGAVDLVAAGVVPEGVDVVHNERWHEGQATSLATAVAWAVEREHEILVVGLGDQPLLTSSVWRAVAEAAEAGVAAVADGKRDRPGGVDRSRIWVATYAGRRRNPVALHRDVWPLLPVSGDEGARAVIRRYPELVSWVPCPGEPIDIDTLADLERWQ